MMVYEEALVFPCEAARLIGILHRPSKPQPRGVLVIVGGPQYRVGSHRQFVLLARYLAERGVPVLRFDYRGMGDSESSPISFEETAPDIKAALDAFFGALSSLEEVVLWGLCDAASAALMYANADSRVRGLVLANPWVRQGEVGARTHMRHYYLPRVLAADTWKRLATGKLGVLSSARDVVRTIIRSARSVGDNEARSGSGAEHRPTFLPRMREGLRAFEGNVLFILSGDDLTAAEFKDEARRSSAWARLLKRSSVSIQDFPDANHTFSRREWRDQVADWTLRWMESW